MNHLLASAAIVVAAALPSLAMAAGDIDAGKALTEKYSCAACHGKDFNTPIDPGYPKLAGQHQDYLEHALLAYQRGTTAANGRNNPIMAGQVKPLSHQDIRNIAAYLHSLPGTLSVRK
jgi:cytochrome c553